MRDEVGEGALLVTVEAFGPRCIEFGPIGRCDYSAFDDVESGRSIIWSKNSIHDLERQRLHTETLELGFISNRIDSDHNFQQRAFRTDPPQVLQERDISNNDSTQQAAPRKVHVHFVSNAAQLTRQIFDRGLNEEYVRRAALRGLTIDLLRNLLEGTSVRIDPDVELVRVSARRLVHKAPVSRPNVDDHTFAGMVG